MFDRIISDVKSFYNEAGEYFSKTRQKSDEEGNSTWIFTRKQLKRLKKGDRVLDLGCGNGRFVTGLKEKIGYLGVDFSEVLLKEARELHPDRKFILRDITKDKFWNELEKERKFDAVFSMATLHHIPTKNLQLKVLKKARKVLKKNGFLCISVWNLWQLKYLEYQTDKSGYFGKNLNWIPVPFQNKWKRFCYRFDKANLSDLLIEAGFEVKDVFYSDGRGGKTSADKGRNLVAFAK